MGDNKIFIKRQQFFPTVLKCPKIVGVKAPIAPWLNTPPFTVKAIPNIVFHIQKLSHTSFN